jgi:hypothetical protein
MVQRALCIQRAAGEAVDADLRKQLRVAATWWAREAMGFVDH